MERAREPLLTMEEIKKIMEHDCTSAELTIVKNISDAWEHRLGDNWETRTGNWQWDLYCMLAAIYLAGRVQGIREERQKNKEKRGKRYAHAC